jgi:hypothetical protein|tara:strand:- start:1406 stop:1900 length:495 start_codon:yes stop_codon:yes gene_type:complete
MIQAITETGVKAFIQTKDNRIDTSVSSEQIRHLIKFTNDMKGGSVTGEVYAYGKTEEIYNRYTKITFDYNVTPNRYEGKIKFLPSGYWKYEVYEVSWLGDVTITETTAPRTETDVLTPPSASKGVVQGLVTKGKMYVSDNAGTEQVQYTQRQEPAASNYIYYGQ